MDAMGSTAIIELAGAAHGDAIVIDTQHVLWDRMSLEAAVGVAASGAAVLVRVVENSAAAISRALDAGAEGVVVPLADDAGEVAQAVAAARFPPRSRRSGGGARRLAAYARAGSGSFSGSLLVLSAFALVTPPFDASLQKVVRAPRADPV
jgi:2-keto-3-deoxy-L-rhamnonate aldolase RhmA